MEDKVQIKKTHSNLSSSVQAEPWHRGGSNQTITFLTQSAPTAATSIPNNYCQKALQHITSAAPRPLLSWTHTLIKHIKHIPDQQQTHRILKYVGISDKRPHIFIGWPPWSLFLCSWVHVQLRLPAQMEGFDVSWLSVTPRSTISAQKSQRWCWTPLASEILNSDPLSSKMEKLLPETSIRVTQKKTFASVG